MSFSRASFIGILVVALVIGLAAASWGQEFRVIEGVKITGGPQFVPGEFLVKFKKGVPEGLIKQINKEHGVSVLSISKWDKLMRLRAPKGKGVGQMVAAYARNPHVKYAEPNYIRQALEAPNDEFYIYQWHMDNGTGNGGINMEEAWGIEPGGSEEVIVAVLDTGLAYNDPEFTDKPVNIKVLPGSDIVNNDDEPIDDNLQFGHGTHVAGTIAQHTNNGTGVAGVAYNTTIMPVKVLDEYGSGSDMDVRDGIIFAADNGAKVINMSLGGEGYSQAIADACSYASDTKGVTIICAAGNNYPDPDPVYPAAYDQCIAVGATRFDETRAYYSNTGAYLDLVAPGGDLNVNQNGDPYVDGVLQQSFTMQFNFSWGWPPFGMVWDYYLSQGTSMAAPHVSGVAALLIAQQGGIGPDKVRECLEKSAKDLGPPGWDEEYGWGKIDAYAALTYSPTTKHDVAVTGVIATPANVVQGGTVQVEVTVANYGDNSESFTVELWDTTSDQQIGISRSVDNLGLGVSTTENFTWNTDAALPGTHVLEGRAILTEDDVQANNTLDTSVTVQEALQVHDVAIVAMSAPTSILLGETVTVEVTVKNEGTYENETTTVTLTESPNNYPFQSQEVTLAQPGDSEVVTFTWDTEGATSGIHTLTAQAAADPSEEDLTDNSISTEVDITQETAMHVESVVVGTIPREAGRNIFVTGEATVTVRDSNDNPVDGAEVQGHWSGATSDTDAALTTGGQVTVHSDEVKYKKKPLTFTFTVDDVVKSGWNYDPSSGHTTGSVTYP